MPPKNKGKKGKKGAEDDEYWEKAGETVAPSSPTPDEAPASNKSKMSFAGFAALDMGADDAGAAPEEEEEDFGGLMSVIKASSKSKKDKKKAKKGAVNDDADGFDDAPAAEADTEAVTASKKAVEMTAEELADEEWGPVKEKAKKGKKAKGKKEKAQDESEDEKIDEAEPSPTPAPASAPPPAEAPAPKEADDDDDAAEEPGAKVLSKKEKEKLKKEREKAKKKAQAAAKKAAAADAPPADQTQSEAPAPPTPAPSAPEPPKAEDEEEGDEGAAGGKADAKKKKKKKAKKDDEPAPAPPPPAAATKKKGGISALKAMMEEKRRLEEEARRAAEEEQRRIEEEERLAAEAERKKEEEKQRRKEKEKAKRELAKKEGRLLTKKQKEEKAMAEIRKQALLASGVQIEGLQQASGSGAPAAKKVVYGNRKKKGPANAAKDASPAPESRPRTPEPVAPAEPEPKPEPEDDWEASSAEEEATPAPVSVPGVKDSWDASSDEEDTPSPPPPASAPANSTPAKSIPAKSTPAKPTPAKAAAKPPAKSAATPKKEPAPPAAKAAPTSKSAAATANATKSAAPAAAESSESEDDSEEDSDDSSESDSDEDSDEDDSSSEEELTVAQKMAAQRKAEAAARRAKAHEEAMAARSKDDLRSPICCILGHVDTGKTKLLDKIRQTNVQEGEAGGITQQIGATYFPVDAIKTKTAVLNKDGTAEYKIPGLLVIDTPGHESFTNLRSRGSSLCNIAILVVDIMHGLEQQTLESLRLLRDRKTPFIVALNKIDRLYGWEATPDGAFRESLAKQPRSTQREFEDRLSKIVVAFAEEGLNAVPYYDNKNFARNVSIVPTSAITGEGVPDMIMLLVNLTQQRMSDRLMYLSELECTVLEVKVIEGLGTTIDVVLSNGILREGDKIVVCGLNGPIVTQVRALLTPQPLRELRVKSNYVHHKEVKAALGVKISAPDLEKAIAGSRLLVCGPDDDEDDLREESGRGVCVQASTLGSLEALLDFLKSSKIPVSGINIGPVHKKDVMRAGTMLEKAKELACILCFDVQVDKDAERLAEEMGIRLFKADIIYHLFDAFTAYNAEIVEAKRKDAAPQAVWPCRLKIIAAFCKRDPIILGVDILDGTLRIGTPIAVVKTDPTTNKKEIIDLGKITSLEINHKTYELVKKSQAGAGVAVKIEHAVYQSAKMFGRHFDDKDELLSHITRQSVDVLKESFRADVTPEEWMLIKHLKPRFGIP
ncbi:Tr-type G domain-containing protein [Mycena sanguinolenta]|uniref:Eukaryotic translation initiation factor 5B n=1 Tax=Mycena sanguinolenta TaxID=230812 RepID=A0A8H6Y9X6_9AGAR|nr:Tr-type G domain-containing protein [Mycena sanguinolenta]